VLTMIVTDSADPPLGRLFAPYLVAEQDPEIAHNGLRIMKVSADHLTRLVKELDVLGQQTRWIGAAPRWTPIVRTPSWDGAVAAATADGILKLGPGRLRLLARAWQAPDLSGDAVAANMVVELLPQHEEAVRRKLEIAAPDRPQEDVDQGLCFERLRAT